MNDAIELLKEGAIAPDFTLSTNGDGEVTLSALKGKPVVVYFYPKDNTPGCTTEALDFTALKDDFAKIGATVIGISPDTVKKHDNFVSKYDLTVLLGADTDTAVCQAYGVWVEKKMYGKSYMGVERSTFLIAPDGTISKIWRKVKVKGHAQEVLTSAQTIAG